MKAVIFDLFGTLVPNIPPARFKVNMRVMAGELGVSPEAFEEEWKKSFKQRMTGEVQDGDQQFVPILQAIGAPIDPGALTRTTAIRNRFLKECLDPKPDALEMLDEMKSRGLKIGLVTDCSSATPGLLEQTTLGTYFPVKAASGILRTRKPDPRMYQHVLDGLQVQGPECMYVGDGNSEELPGAKHFDMCTVWVDNGNRQYWRDSFVPEADHTIRELTELVPLVDAKLSAQKEG